MGVPGMDCWKVVTAEVPALVAAKATESGSEVVDVEMIGFSFMGMRGDIGIVVARLVVRFGVPAGVV
jgi:hypothetical protein